MPDTLLRKVAIVTGAASGIGRHWAGVLAGRPEQYRLMLVDANEDALRDSFVPRDGLALRAFDIRSPDEWLRLVDDTLARFGRIDYLFNIAGGSRPGFLLDVPLAAVDATIDVNLKGPVYAMRIVAPVMVQQGSGHIVNVASLAGVSPTPGNELYSAAKCGLRSISIATAVRLRAKGVYVTTICPDLVDTPAMARQLDLEPADVALIHSGPRALTVRDLERAFERAMRERPLELMVPAWRGWLARLNNLFPSLMPRLYGPLLRRGMRRLADRRVERQDRLARLARVS